MTRNLPDAKPPSLFIWEYGVTVMIDMVGLLFQLIPWEQLFSRRLKM